MVLLKKLSEIKIDDDQDSIWLTVDIGDGASCHVGYRSCFYRSIPLGPIDNGRKVKMKFLQKKKKNLILKKFIKVNQIQQKYKIYEKQKNWSNRLLKLKFLLKKIINKINYIDEI